VSGDGWDELLRRGAATTPAGTELQVCQRALRDLLFDARDQLDEDVFCAWVMFLIEVVAREAARCSNWTERAA
jgi:hypothetical protein